MQARANKVVPEQNAVCDQGLNCLPLMQPFVDTSAGSKIDLFKV